MKYKKTRLHTVSTQTDLFEMYYPRVVLSRLSRIPGNSTVSKKRNINSTVCSNKPSVVKKAPRTYYNFVRPITNNDRANSTLTLNSPLENPEDQHSTIQLPKIRNRRSSQAKRVRFKPGPLCYKQKLLKQNCLNNEDGNDADDDFDVPRMLGRAGSSSDENLGTVIEVTERSAQQVDLNIEEKSIHLNDVEEIILPTNISLNTAYLNVESSEGLDNIVKDKTLKACDTADKTGKFMDILTAKDNDDWEREAILKTADPTTETEEQIPQLQQNTNIHFEGSTTILSHNSFHGGNGHNNYVENEKTNENENENEQTFETSTKFIKVIAHTVHIHNHFHKF